MKNKIIPIALLALTPISSIFAWSVPVNFYDMTGYGNNHSDLDLVVVPGGLVSGITGYSDHEVRINPVNQQKGTITIYTEGNKEDFTVPFTVYATYFHSLGYQLATLTIHGYPSTEKNSAGDYAENYKATINLNAPYKKDWGLKGSYVEADHVKLASDNYKNENGVSVYNNNQPIDVFLKATGS